MGNREMIEQLLRSTNREGIEGLIDYMDKNGFYTAPCSTAYHLSVKGGLAEHTLNVWKFIQRFESQIRDTLPQNIETASLIIVSILHDLGKMGQHGKPQYTENLLKSGKLSDAKPYSTNKELSNVPHEVRSVSIAKMFIDLTEDEEYAILCHNGLYGDFRYVINGNETPLYLLLHDADMWASRVVEDKEKSNYYGGEADGI